MVEKHLKSEWKLSWFIVIIEKYIQMMVGVLWWGCMNNLSLVNAFP